MKALEKWEKLKINQLIGLRARLEGVKVFNQCKSSFNRLKIKKMVKYEENPNERCRSTDELMEKGEYVVAMVDARVLREELINL